MPEKHSPLSRLIVFMVCLSIAGSIVAGAEYVTGGSPGLNAEGTIDGPPSNDILTNNQEADAIACLKPTEAMKEGCCRDYGIC